MASATERICEQLEAAGVSFVRSEQIIENAYWGVSWFVGDTQFELRENDERTDLAIFHATPEQAIAVTLGSGECKITTSATDGLCGDDPKVYYELSCGHRMMLYGLDVPIRCAVCGKAVKR